MTSLGFDSMMLTSNREILKLENDSLIIPDVTSKHNYTCAVLLSFLKNFMSNLENRNISYSYSEPNTDDDDKEYLLSWYNSKNHLCTISIWSDDTVAMYGSYFEGRTIENEIFEFPERFEKFLRSLI